MSRQGWRAVGWFTYPVLGVLAVVAAHAVHERGFGWLPRDVAAAARVLLPTLVPAHARYTVDPWPTLLWSSVLLTAAFALAAAGTAVLALVGAQPWWKRFVWLWALAVVVGVGVAGLAELGEVWLSIDRFGGRGGSHIRLFTIPALREAVVWGVLWGWGPALVTALVGPTAVRRPGGGGARGGVTPAVVHRGRVLVAAAIVATLVVGAAASGAWLVRVSYDAAESTATAVRQPDAGPTGPTDPPAPVAPSEEDVVRCSADEVVVTWGGHDAAVGYRQATVTVENRSSGSCVVDRYPDLAFADADGDELRPAVDHGGGSGTGTLELGPGESARSTLSWRGDQAPAGSVTVAQVLIAPWAGAPRTVADEALDVVDGGDLTVSAWSTVAAP
ncbi:DUF4232 domain-containing protein [Cellulosimicrobium cellulans]|uniref:DUF4232 domain-containing protein n=1 Tax=Cellulosimicrobium cellulans TaxID=1710 RepID=UPI0036E03613